MASAQPAERTGNVGPTAAGGLRVPAPSAWWVLIAGVIGLLASMALTVEKIRILLDPAYAPSCNINPVVSCGSVMTTPQASLLGFPNPLVGIAGFTVVVVTGVLAVTKVPLPRWYWTGLSLGILTGAVLVHWLIFQSLYRIGALCPYCMVVWVMTVTLLVVSASIAARPMFDGNSDSDGAGGGDGDAGRPSAVAQVFYQWRWSVFTLWFTAVFLLIMVRFWNYWSTLV